MSKQAIFDDMIRKTLQQQELPQKEPAIEEMKEIVRGFFRDRLTQCITELQLLDSMASEDDFDISSPEDYSPNQQEFIADFLNSFEIRVSSAEELRQAIEDSPDD